MTKTLALAIAALLFAGIANASTSYIESAFNPAQLPSPIPTLPIPGQSFTAFIIWSDDLGVVGFTVTVSIDGAIDRRSVRVIPGEAGAMVVFSGSPQQVTLIDITEMHGPITKSRPEDNR